MALISNTNRGRNSFSFKGKKTNWVEVSHPGIFLRKRYKEYPRERCRFRSMARFGMGRYQSEITRAYPLPHRCGGFINDNTVFIQDHQHFNGNQLIFASEYLNSFQLAPYYANSTTASFYAIGHFEHHFNGFLTNKIPFFRRLNWFLVGGANAFYVNRDNNYIEAFAGLENIFKVLRVDVVASYLNGKSGTVGLRIGLGGVLGNSINIGR